MNKIKIYYNVSSELQQREYLEGNVIIKDQCLEVNAIDLKDVLSKSLPGVNFVIDEKFNVATNKVYLESLIEFYVFKIRKYSSYKQLLSQSINVAGDKSFVLESLLTGADDVKTFILQISEHNQNIIDEFKNIKLADNNNSIESIQYKKELS